MRAVFSLRITLICLRLLRRHNNGVLMAHFAPSSSPDRRSEGDSRMNSSASPLSFPCNGLAALLQKLLGSSFLLLQTVQYYVLYIDLLRHSLLRFSGCVFTYATPDMQTSSGPPTRFQYLKYTKKLDVSNIKIIYANKRSPWPASFNASRAVEACFIP